MSISYIAPPKDSDILVRKRNFNPQKRRWGEWEIMLRRSEVTPPSTVFGDETQVATPSQKSFSLSLGGKFTIYPNLLSSQRQQALKEELRSNEHLFRQYSIQSGDEPRAHLLLHDKATMDDFETSSQPGYRYGCTTLKARPISMLPNLESFASDMADVCGVGEWNTGVNVVSYRDNKDKIGFHSDNDQGEERIVTVLVESQDPPRGVQIENMRPKGKSKARREGDEQFELFIGQGDGYEMDGEMQKHYVHGVPMSKDTTAASRTAIVFRQGRYEEYTRDSGVPLRNLEPRIVATPSFGRVNGLVEGELYSRNQMRKLGAHMSIQSGVNGSKENGCYAIVVSGGRSDGLGEDRMDRLVYAAETKVGAGAILTSMKNSTPIRVFRSSSAANRYKAILDPSGSPKCRYDGLYFAKNVSFLDENGKECSEYKEPGEQKELKTKLVVNRVYQFHLERVDAGFGNLTNEKSIEELMDYSILNSTMLVIAHKQRRIDMSLQWPVKLKWPLPAVSPKPEISAEEEAQSLLLATAAMSFGLLNGEPTSYGSTSCQGVGETVTPGSMKCREPSERKGEDAAATVSTSPRMASNANDEIVLSSTNERSRTITSPVRRSPRLNPDPKDGDSSKAPRKRLGDGNDGSGLPPANKRSRTITPPIRRSPRLIQDSRDGNAPKKATVSREATPALRRSPRNLSPQLLQAKGNLFVGRRLRSSKEY